MFPPTHTRVSSLLGLVLMSAIPPVPAATSHAFATDTEVGVIGKEHVKLRELPPDVQEQLAESKRRYERQLHQLALDYRRNEYAIVETGANNLIDDKIMQSEAKARSIALQELTKEIKTPEITQADIHSFYEQHKQQIKQPLEQVTAPITQYLTQQAATESKHAYLAGLRVKYAAHVSFEPLRENVEALGPALGSKNARVTIVEFSDFQCPFCQQMEPALKQALEKYPNDVRLVYRQMPLTEVHPNAMRAAQASLCANEQGKFWPIHDALFAGQDSLDIVGLKKMAQAVQLEANSFSDCLESGKMKPQVNADMDAAALHGVAGTPALFVNGRFVNGVISFEQIAALIDDELARASVPKPAIASGPIKR